MIFIDFFFKGPTKTAPQEKIVAPLKMVYLDAFPSYEAGNYVTTQQTDKKWCKASNSNEKKIIKVIRNIKED